MTLLEELKRIRDDGPRRQGWGICGNLSLNALALELQDVAQQWPKHSGVWSYPVPSPSGSPQAGYRELPKWDGEYGALRMELVNWCIEQLEQGQ